MSALKCPECGMMVNAPSGSVSVTCPICDVALGGNSSSAVAPQPLKQPPTSAPKRIPPKPSNADLQSRKPVTNPTPVSADTPTESAVGPAVSRGLGALVFLGALGVVLLLGLAGAVAIGIAVFASGKKAVADKGSSNASIEQRNTNHPEVNFQPVAQRIESQGSGSPAPQKNALPPDLQAKVNTAVDKGQKYLYEELSRQNNTRTNAHFGGESALAALTLLECGVPANDPVIVAAADRVREAIRNATYTYSVATAIIFFDRLGNQNDEQLIRTLAMRLIAGQRSDGMWGYNDAVALSASDETGLFDYLREINTDRDVLHGTAKLADNKKLINLPEKVRVLPIIKTLEAGRVDLGKNLPERGKGLTDNSITQFCLLALWVAKRHDIPAQPSLALTEEHFRKTQLNDGSWTYRPSSPTRKSSMTCAGLLGLAVGAGVKGEKQGDKEDKVLGDAMKFLGSKIEKPFAANQDGWGELYFLWSLERVAMVFDLQTIGGKDWYRWAADTIVTMQQPAGSWQKGHPTMVDTSFALLVLKRVNVAKDLTTTLNKLINVKNLETGQ